jgi:hypothetical protein
MKKVSRLISEVLVGVVILFVFSQVFRMLWQLFLDANYVTEYIATGVITLFLAFLMVMTIGLALQARKQS